MKISWSANKILIIFSCIYLLLSLLIYIHVPSINPHRDIDSWGYEKQALLSKSTTSSIVHQPSGYPIFMKTIYKTFGTNDAFLIWIQILLTLLSGLLLFLATKHLFGEPTALIAFALFTINIGYLTFSQFILAEGLLTFFLILFVERFAYFSKTKSLSALATAGFILGLSTIIKPAGLYFIVPLAIIVTLFTKKIRVPLILICSFMVPVTIYGIKTISSLGNYNLYVWYASKVATDQQHFDSAKQRSKIFFKELEKRPSSITKAKIDFWQNVKSNPYPFIKTWIREMLKTHFGLFSTNLKLLLEPSMHGGDVSFFTTPGTYATKVVNYATAGTSSLTLKTISIIEFIWNILKYFLVFLGFLSLALKRKWFLLAFFSSYIFYFTLVTGFDGCARYRTMFEFVLIMLIAVGLVGILKIFNVLLDTRHYVSHSKIR